MYASIDETMSKIARRLRKYKTRMLSRAHRPRKNKVKKLAEAVFIPEEIPQEEENTEQEPVTVHKENFNIKPLYPDEAIMELELNHREFMIFQNEQSGKLAIVFRRKDGDYGLVEPETA